MTSARSVRWLLVLALGLLAAGLTSRPAHAIEYELTIDHCTGGCGPAPYGSVTLTQDGGDVDVLVDLFDSNYFVKTGSVDFQAFKFNGTDITLADIVVDPHVPALQPATGNFNGDGTGDFSLGINCPSCGGGASSQFNTDISFRVLSATIADLTVPNSLGFVFVADIISGATGNTGPVAAGGTPVPEPGTLLLLGSGLVSVGAWSRRRMRGRTLGRRDEP